MEARVVARSITVLVKAVSITCALLFALFPLWWTIVTSLKPGPELFSDVSPLWPRDPTLDNYRQLITETDFLTWLLNSLLVSIVSTLLTLVLATPAAYAIVRLPSAHSRAFGLSAILGYGLTPTILIVPMFVVATSMGAYDKPWTLALVYPTFMIPFATWLLAGFIAGVPASVEDAARIDGCSTMEAFIFVTLPLIKTGVLSTLIFCFLLAWGEYVYALGLTGSANLRTVPVGISSLVSGDIYQWGMIMAAAVLAALPVTLLLFLSRRNLVSGLTAGALKK
jgi:ABC-type glycerol-3-phosphate transport system permease component